MPSTETPKLPPVPVTDGDTEAGYGLTIDEGGAEEVLFNSIDGRSTLTDASHMAHMIWAIYDMAEIFLNYELRKKII